MTACAWVAGDAAAVARWKPTLEAFGLTLAGEPGVTDFAGNFLIQPDGAGMASLCIEGGPDRAWRVLATLADPPDAAELAGVLSGFNHVLPIAEECQALVAHLLALVDDDPDLADELLASLLLTNLADQRALARVLQEDQWDEVKRLAHRIKGTAQLSGTRSLAAFSGLMEVAGDRGDRKSGRALALLFIPAVRELSVQLERAAQSRARPA